MLVDLSKEAGQVPCLKVIAWWSSRGGAVAELPAILLEVSPVPRAKNRVHGRQHLLGGGCKLGLHQPNSRFGQVTLDFASERNAFRDCLDSFGKSLVD